ncbi:N5-glutamine methyltransferase, modifies release factors RF-1 and RF-2 [Georgfuchsia toluolica]|uniref:Release factor glutamine methyltransferase n=1 Tax=Georgfuchsia toluolica TaxID=424218 RepID=A0A916J441_9PROT|nr:peptide chain release factor N(5)-glutamine methyltransferase [Georgfuchsia toluolica]CAG4883018.1 N5-glutamine methyltransferase, modifies release factors RF-1 and RF-2 [Georgfuchsia toluolica]
MSTIGAALAAARQKIGVTEARLLLCYLLGCSAAHIEAHREDELDSAVAENFRACVERRWQGVPIAYLMQTREFYGRPFAVTPAVLIPRPETELIVDTVLGKFERYAKPRVLDLGTGSGCLAITLALELPQAEVTAVDISRDALSIAAGNARQFGATVRLLESDWFSSIANEQFDLIVSNPPYIAAGDPHLTQGDLRFEPSQALASGADGLDAIRHIAETAPAHLSAGGWLLFEHGYDQAERVRALLAATGYGSIEQRRDLAGIVRVSGGRAP